MGRKLAEPDDLYDSDGMEESESWLDTGPVPTRRSGTGKPASLNHRRKIEDLQEEWALRKLLRELDFDD